MATLQERLDDAEQALHDLLTGKSVAQVRDANGEMITYTQADRVSLRAYIAELKRKIDPTTVVGPMRPFFT